MAFLILRLGHPFGRTNACPKFANNPRSRHVHKMKTDLVHDHVVCRYRGLCCTRCPRPSTLRGLILLLCKTAAYRLSWFMVISNERGLKFPLARRKTYGGLRLLWSFPIRFRGDLPGFASSSTFNTLAGFHDRAGQGDGPTLRATWTSFSISFRRFVFPSMASLVETI